MDEIINSVQFNKSWDILIVPCVMIAFDIITGFLNAWKNNDIDSSKLRTGLVHKAGEIIMLIIPEYLEVSMNIPHYVPTLMSVYIIVMELISIVENLALMGVDIPKGIKNKLEKLKMEGDYDGKEE